MRLSYAAPIVFALPLIEIAGFVLVGSRMGVLPTIGLVLASAFAGVLLMRVLGLGILSRIRADLAAGRDPGRQVVHGLMIAVAGVLLLIPGFFTDIVGLLLFVPSLREIGWRALKRRLVPHPLRSGGLGPTGWSSGRMIELDNQDFARRGEPNSPWRRSGED